MADLYPKREDDDARHRRAHAGRVIATGDDSLDPHHFVGHAWIGSIGWADSRQWRRLLIGLEASTLLPRGNWTTSKDLDLGMTEASPEASRGRRQRVTGYRVSPIRTHEERTGLLFFRSVLASSRRLHRMPRSLKAETGSRVLTSRHDPQEKNSGRCVRYGKWCS